MCYMKFFPNLKRKSRFFGLFLVLLPVIGSLSSCDYFFDATPKYDNWIKPGKFVMQGRRYYLTITEIDFDTFVSLKGINTVRDMASNRTGDFYQITITNVRDSSASFVFETLTMNPDIRAKNTCAYWDANGNSFMPNSSKGKGDNPPQDYIVSYNGVGYYFVEDSLE